MNEMIGRELGPYRILEQIGTGGMATVYKAYHAAMDRYVAVKVLPEQMSLDAEFRKRFDREAKLIARLEHAHILPVHDYGQAGNRLYLVMRYVEAGTLKEQIAGRPMSLAEANRVLHQVGGALDYAHRLGVIHRDVKPSNVMIDVQGDCYLTDFGLARMLEGSARLTATGVGVGTPAYMSPEQGRGDKADARGDVYSLGVMLYEMVTGQVPYQAETPLAVVLKHITEPLPLPRSVRPDLPDEVERVILKALAKNPDDRFQTVQELVSAFDAAARLAEAEMPQAARPAPGQKKAAPSRLRLPRWAQVALGATAGIVALIVLAFVLSRIPLQVQVVGGRLEVVRVSEVTPLPSPTSAAAVGPTVTQTPTATPTATPAPTTTPTATPAPTVTPTATLAPTVTLTASQVTPTLSLPAVAGECYIVYADDRTGNTEIYAANSDGTDERRLTDDPAGDWSPVWSPDGTQIVFTSDREATHAEGYQLYVMNADGSSPTRLTTRPDRNAKSASWSPDGSRIAFHSYCDLVVIDADGSNWTTLVGGGEGLCADFPTWSPDGRRIAFRNMTLPGGPPPVVHDIYVVNDDGSGLLKLATLPSEDWSQHVVWSPDGSQVAFDVLVDGQERYYAVSSDGSGELTEISSIPDSWYPWSWPQWDNQTPMAQARALAARASEYVARKHWMEALAAISEAIRLDPGNPQYYLQRAFIYDAGLGKRDEAIADADKAVELAPTLYEAWQTRGCTCMHFGECEAALTDINQAISLDSQRFDGYVDRADALYCLGRLDEAIADYGRGLAINPDSAWAHWTRGMLYEGKGDLDAALTDYNQAIALLPDDPWASTDYCNSRAGVYRAQGRHQQALADCAAILALISDDPRGFYCRGMSELALGQKDQARADFQQAVSLTPVSAWSAWVTEAAQAELDKLKP